MTIETVAVLLSINRIGAIAMPLFSGYGVDAIASRLNAIKAKALFTCDGFPRRGKFYDAFSTAKAAAANCESISKIFVLRNGENMIDDQGLPKAIVNSPSFFPRTAARATPSRPRPKTR
ncbi:MAG: acetyl-coenzyme A synthetase [Acidobacteria bacterium OLB17]|nr:MAG: acetyl-coenzyme A synthetase [Acidobacteria bacterium OLB17]